MTTPIVTEIAPSLEPVVRDPFLDAAGEPTTPTNVRRPPAAARPGENAAECPCGAIHMEPEEA